MKKLILPILISAILWCEAPQLWQPNEMLYVQMEISEEQRLESEKEFEEFIRRINEPLLRRIASFFIFWK